MAHTALRCPGGGAAHTSEDEARQPAHAARSTAQALVEFTLVVPVMLLLLLGMVEFGRAYSAGIALEGAVREGARLASTLPIPAGDGTCGSSAAATKWCAAVTARVEQAAQPEVLADADVLICSVSVSPPAPPPACPVSSPDGAPTASGQAVTVTASTFKQFYVSFLTRNSLRWLGFGTGLTGIPVQASSTMRVP